MYFVSSSWHIFWYKRVGTKMRLLMSLIRHQIGHSTLVQKFEWSLVPYSGSLLEIHPSRLVGLSVEWKWRSGASSWVQSVGSCDYWYNSELDFEEWGMGMAKTMYLFQDLGSLMYFSANFSARRVGNAPSVTCPKCGLDVGRQETLDRGQHVCKR